MMESNNLLLMWIGLESIMLSELSQERDRHRIFSYVGYKDMKEIANAQRQQNWLSVSSYRHILVEKGVPHGGWNTGTVVEGSRHSG